MQVRRRDPLALAHPARAFWIVAIAAFIADQVTKSIVRIVWRAPAPAIIWDRMVDQLVTTRLDAGETIQVLGDFLQLTHVRNTGAAFGIFPGYQPVFVATSLVVLLVIGAYWRRARPQSWPVVIGMALVAGGALGNLVDRAVIGKVTDFFYVAVIDFPVFNIADSAIVVGVGMLIAWLLFGPQPEDETPLPEPHPAVEGSTDPQLEPELSSGLRADSTE